MARKKRIDIRHYCFERNDRFFLDANVWLSIYGPIACLDWRTTVYSAGLRDMRINRCQIRVDALVLSEFINRFARLEFKQVPSNSRPRTFKIFRDSKAFRGVAEEIAVSARKVVEAAKRCSSGFDVVDIGEILSEYESGNCDFNDQMVRELCKMADLTLVTHDSDFRDSDIRILTANNRLLR